MYYTGRKSKVEMSNIANVLDALTSKGELYEARADGAVRCFACGHRCLIRPGMRGICQVRFNEEGVLRVPFGYVAALQADPIEKKPFNHVLPGAAALTFGMLGCDFHCGFCFTGDTVVITDWGPRTLEECFASCANVEKRPDGEIGIPSRLTVIAASGKSRKAKAVFKHPYRGPMTVIHPYYLPALQCTPDHRVFATDDASRAPELIKAENLTTNHYLAIPRKFSFSSLPVVDVAKILGNRKVEYQIPWKFAAGEVEAVMQDTEMGKTSREIGLKLGKSSSYIRHVRSKFRRGRIQRSYIGQAIVEDNTVRFPNEHRPGIPAQFIVNEEIARLFGLYCAEGSTSIDKKRPNSFSVSFSFSPKERDYAEEVRDSLKHNFHLEASITKRATALGVSTGKSSFGLLMKSLAGGKASEKRVPESIFQSKANVVRAFLGAIVDGDGHRFTNGKVSVTTVSHDLAYGIAWLALKLGYLPSLYDARMPEDGMIQGRRVRRSPHQYTVVWYQDSAIRRKVITTDDYYLIPLRSIETTEFDGDVFNMEVEGEHTYLAGFFAVSNCQNWYTSQAMRDPNSDPSIELVRRISPRQMVEAARRTQASVVVSSYNEPLITSEWAAAIFKEAKAAGLKCAYVSNGNNTPEVMEYLRPYLDAYKVDLKSMNDKNYRKLGGVLQNTLDGIKRAREMGLWVEVVTLVIPGFNDSSEELWDAARFLAGISLDIPWHVTAFHKDYKMTDPANTDARILQRAADIGREAGLHFVYAGNLPGRVGEYEDTFCPGCNQPVVRRSGYTVREYRITGQGTCAHCGTKIPGVWPGNPADVPLGGWGMPLPVY
jgi:pyruvate formate lyase activating enzyme